jgi:hypothetical protein
MWLLLACLLCALSSSSSSSSISSSNATVSGAVAQDSEDCGDCRQWVTGKAYDGNDFLPAGGPCPEWFSALGAGDCKATPSQPALIFENKEACCTFCIEHNRRSLQPPCTHASFGPTGSGLENVCYAKAGTPSPLESSRLTRDSFLAGEPCKTYSPRSPLSWGVVFLITLALGAAVYLVGGTRAGARRHPHTRTWRELWGLVVDGWSFARGGGHSPGGAQAADESPRSSLLPHTATAAVEGTTATPPRQAPRGPTTQLHQSAAIGNTGAVQKLLQAGCDTIDAGDKRNFTAFHIACAGGHAEIVRELLEAGCDCDLVNDSGVDGWELAASLRRADVLALCDSTRTSEKKRNEPRRTKKKDRPPREKRKGKGARGAVTAAAGSQQAGAKGPPSAVVRL